MSQVFRNKFSVRAVPSVLGRNGRRGRRRMTWDSAQVLNPWNASCSCGAIALPMKSSMSSQQILSSSAPNVWYPTIVRSKQWLANSRHWIAWIANCNGAHDMLIFAHSVCSVWRPPTDTNGSHTANSCSAAETLASVAVAALLSTIRSVICMIFSALLSLVFSALKDNALKSSVVISGTKCCDSLANRRRLRWCPKRCRRDQTEDLMAFD